MSDWISREATIEAFLPAGGLDYAHLSKKEIVAILRALPAVQPDALVEINQLGAEFDSEIFSRISNKLLALIDKPAAPHVNETPKSEHVPGDVLTPTTKGGAEGPLITGLVARNMTVGFYDKPATGDA